MGAGSPETAAVAALLVMAAALAGVAAGGDIVHQDDDAPKIPGCSNDFMLVRYLPAPPPASLIAARGGEFGGGSGQPEFSAPSWGSSDSGGTFGSS